MRKLLIMVFAVLAVPGQLFAQACAGAKLSAEGEPAPLKAFNLQRACSLYEDIAIYHLSAREVPDIAFVLKKKVDCKDKDVILFGKNMECTSSAERAPGLVTIYLEKDDPKLYVGLLIDAIDYAGRLYVNRARLVSVALKVLAELDEPELKKRFHGEVNVRDLRR